MVNDTVNEHVYTVNKRVSIREATGVNSKELRSEIMNLTLHSMYNLSGSFIPERVRCVALTCCVAPRDVLRHFSPQHAAAGPYAATYRIR